MTTSISTIARQLYWRLANRMNARGKSRYPSDFSDDEIATLELVREKTLTTPERVISLIRATEHIVRQEIPGDIVECGVWKGGSIMAAALTLVRLDSLDRSLYLYDTFDGMPPPTDLDKDHLGNSAAAQLAVMGKDADIWARAQIDEVRMNMESVSYPRERVIYIKGKVEDTIPAHIPEGIALLRLDTDWYESTKHELEQLYPRLSSGGVLILDDYGQWAGARQAVDEYISKHRLNLLLCRIDMGGRIAIKP